MAFQPITEAEAQALTRRQLLQRVEETQAWLDRPPRSAAKRAAGVECSRVMHAHRSIGKMLDSSLALVQGQRGAGAGYLDERVDGSPARPPTRIQLSRQRRMPYGCKNVSRPGPYGNPFTVAEYGDEAVAMFRDLLAHPDRYPDLRYPSLRQIQEEPAGWDLACWCPIPEGYISPGAAATRLHLVLTAVMHDQDERCHADVLLWVAAGGKP
jgi:hypothetical protein